MRDDMVMRSVYLRPDEDSALRQLAFEIQVTKSDLIRSAISAKLVDWLEGEDEDLIRRDLELGRRLTPAERAEKARALRIEEVKVEEAAKKVAARAKKARAREAADKKGASKGKVSKLPGSLAARLFASAKQAKDASRTKVVRSGRPASERQPKEHAGLVAAE